MKRVVSGVKPTGDLTLGNYLGAMKRWAAMSKQPDAEHFFFIPNLHALTVRPDPRVLRKDTRSAVAWLLAMGVDPSHSYIFVQSQLPAHSELAWILNNYTTIGELNRMTQF
ncbi:tryptophan--tRNA ligase, partial [Streptococcus suis]